MRRTIDGLIAAVAVLAFVGVAFSQPKQDPPGTQYATGVIVPKDIEARVARSWVKHARNLKALPTVTADAYDARTLGLVPAIKNQGNCGSCYIFSGVGPAETAGIKAGKGKADQFILAEQFFLDCESVGGCGGGWPEDIARICKEQGVPLSADYKPYEGRKTSCKNVSKLFRIDDYGYVGSSSGIPSAQAIKDAMVKYGPISVCVAADNALSNYRSGVFKGNARNINHAVMLVGWRTENGKTIWIMRNSWGTGWGMAGYAEMEEGANQIGDSAMWIYVAGAPIPPEPDPEPIPPVPPDPNPPIPGGTEWRWDPVTRKLHVPADVKVTGGNTGGDMLDLTGVPSDIAALLRALAESHRKKAQQDIPRTMPRTIPKASNDIAPLPIHFAFADLSVPVVPVKPEVSDAVPDTVPYTPPDPPNPPEKEPTKAERIYAKAVKEERFLLWLGEAPCFSCSSWPTRATFTITISGPWHNGKHIIYATLPTPTQFEVETALAKARAAWEAERQVKPIQADPFAQPAAEAQQELPVGGVEVLEMVNRQRAARGLRPFVFDPQLTRAAIGAARARAQRLLFGHLPNDFVHLPSGCSADAAGCAAYPESYGFMACCVYDNYTYAGAAWVKGADGKMYCHIFVKR